MFENEVRNVLEKRMNTNDEDDFTIYKYRDELVELLSKNEEETIKILCELSEEEILYVSEVFEEIAEKLQSCSYINFLWKLERKFPNLNLKRCVEVAENFVDKKC
ncbi:MAG: hypothetical protein LBV03_06505 [Fusobacteriales bacterium]|jgi:SMC interacting uncharacterized protein involved in chromosome segregation|nr:hypothetical protein [Fusobacteriales bacterium]